MPSGAAVDEKGVVHIADSANRRLVGRSPAGAVLAIWKLGSGTQTALNSPTRVAAHGKRIYLADTADDRIVVLVLK